MVFLWFSYVYGIDYRAKLLLLQLLPRCIKELLSNGSRFWSQRAPLVKFSEHYKNLDFSGTYDI